MRARRSGQEPGSPLSRASRGGVFVLHGRTETWLAMGKAGKHGALASNGWRISRIWPGTAIAFILLIEFSSHQILTFLALGRQGDVTPGNWCFSNIYSFTTITDAPHRDAFNFQCITFQESNVIEALLRFKFILNFSV